MKLASIFVLSAAIAAMSLAAPAAFAASPAPATPMPTLDEAAKTLSPEPAAKPLACEIYQFDAKSKLIGQWSLKQRDDGQDWSGPWDIEFRNNGTWSQLNGDGGYWCQDEKSIFFSFETDPHTTYRGELSGDKATGTESWNGGGTGIFEISRLKK
jgi:hypothetical protein